MFRRKYSFQLIVLFFVLFYSLSTITTPTTARFTYTTVINGHVTIEEQVILDTENRNSHDMEFEELPKDDEKQLIKKEVPNNTEVETE